MRQKQIRITQKEFQSNPIQKNMTDATATAGGQKQTSSKNKAENNCIT